MYNIKLYAIIILGFLEFNLQAQNPTFNDIYDIIQIKCGGCHNGDIPDGALDFSGSVNDVYDALVNINPSNPSASSKGYKRVAPGYPKKSYLLHKLANGDWDNNYGLETSDGDAMPPLNTATPLVKKEIELIRQWILYGAPLEETVVDPQILEDYYENGLALPTTDVLEPPLPSEGFQIHLGPFFVPPLAELEYFKKHDTGIPEGFEITKFDARFNDESHHLLLYEMNPNLNSTQPDGLRNINEASQFQNRLLAPWQDPDVLELPATTAYKLDAGNFFDLNYHIKNYSVTGVLAANLYLNVYTQPNGTAQHEMHAEYFPISFFQFLAGAPLGSTLIVPPDGEEVTFTEHLWMLNSPDNPFHVGTWHIWQLSSHTHSRGIDYDIYLAADETGAKGEQIYEGFYNYDYTFNQGYYDSEHPATRYFDPLLPVDMTYGGGLVHEATFVNNGTETLNWGPSINDEMMNIFVHYTTSPITTTVEEIDENIEQSFHISPNPYQDQCNITYTLENKENIVLSVHNLLGEQVASLVNDQQNQGKYTYSFSAENLGLPKGMYIITLSVNGAKTSRKVMESY